jgi:small GTP-binding protein
VYSEVAAYEFTTLTTVPGVVRYKGAKIQLLDLPGIIEGAKDGKGRGRQVIAVARTCSLILIVLDVLKPLHHKALLEHELEGFGIRLNKRPPLIYFRKKDKGGVNLTSQVIQSELDMDTVKTILSEYKIHNADVTLREDCTAEDLIDVIEGNRVYVPCIYVLNKIDQITVEVSACVRAHTHHTLRNSTLSTKYPTVYRYRHITSGTSTIYSRKFGNICDSFECKCMRVRVRIVRPACVLFFSYTKPKGQLPDYNSPIVLPHDQTSIEDFCTKIHKSLVKEFK